MQPLRYTGRWSGASDDLHQSPMNTPPTRFTVLIVNYNGGAMLRDCVRSVLALRLRPTQVVVVDNGSRDGSVEDLERESPGCVVLRNGCNAGFARAVNRGLATVPTEFALLLNNDARLQPGAIEALADFLDATPRAAFLGGRLLHEDGRLQNSVAAFPRLSAELLPRALLRALWPARYHGRPAGDTPLQVESVIGALFAVRMAAVAGFGPLDEDFFFFLEETEWCHRAQAHGWQVWHVPAARAVHLQGATAKRHNALARIEYHRSRLLYYRKTAPGRHLIALVVALVKAAVNAAAYQLLALFSLGLVARVRGKAALNLRILVWYLQGRPDAVGLPDKCRPAPSSPTTAARSVAP